MIGLTLTLRLQKTQTYNLMMTKPGSLLLMVKNAFLSFCYHYHMYLCINFCIFDNLVIGFNLYLLLPLSTFVSLKTISDFQLSFCYVLYTHYI